MARLYAATAAAVNEAALPEPSRDAQARLDLERASNDACDRLRQNKESFDTILDQLRQACALFLDSLFTRCDPNERAAIVGSGDALLSHLLPRPAQYERIANALSLKLENEYAQRAKKSKAKPNDTGKQRKTTSKSDGHRQATSQLRRLQRDSPWKLGLVQVHALFGDQYMQWRFVEQLRRLAAVQPDLYLALEVVRHYRVERREGRLGKRSQNAPRGADWHVVDIRLGTKYFTPEKEMDACKEKEPYAGKDKAMEFGKEAECNGPRDHKTDAGKKHEIDAGKEHEIVTGKEHEAEGTGMRRMRSTRPTLSGKEDEDVFGDEQDQTSSPIEEGRKADMACHGDEDFGGSSLFQLDAFETGGADDDSDDGLQSESAAAKSRPPRSRSCPSPRQAPAPVPALALDQLHQTPPPPPPTPPPPPPPPTRMDSAGSPARKRARQHEPEDLDRLESDGLLRVLAFDNGAAWIQDCFSIFQPALPGEDSGPRSAFTLASVTASSRFQAFSFKPDSTQEAASAVLEWGLAEYDADTGDTLLHIAPPCTDQGSKSILASLQLDFTVRDSSVRYQSLPADDDTLHNKTQREAPKALRPVVWLRAVAASRRTRASLLPAPDTPPLLTARQTQRSADDEVALSPRQTAKFSTLPHVSRPTGESVVSNAIANDLAVLQATRASIQSMASCRNETRMLRSLVITLDQHHRTSVTPSQDFTNELASLNAVVQATTSETMCYQARKRIEVIRAQEKSAPRVAELREVNLKVLKGVKQCLGGDMVEYDDIIQDKREQVDKKAKDLRKELMGGLEELKKYEGTDE